MFAVYCYMRWRFQYQLPNHNLWFGSINIFEWKNSKVYDRIHLKNEIYRDIEKERELANVLYEDKRRENST